MAIEPTEPSLRDKGSLVEVLWHAVDEGAGSLESVPGLVRRVIETEAWRKRIYKGRTFEHARFIDFITSKPLAGCGWPPEKVEALIKDDPETLTLWREAVTPPHGGNHRDRKSDNVTLDGRGNTKSYTLSRLKRKAPKLYRRVVDGELTANAAAIEAGFRKKLTPFEQVIKLLPTLTDSERADLLGVLKGWRQ